MNGSENVGTDQREPENPNQKSDVDSSPAFVRDVLDPKPVVPVDSGKIDTAQCRAKANESMSLSQAIWLAKDIAPINNIDIAAKRLAIEVWLLERELGRTCTEANWKA